jgi:flagellar hook assembly protein FlgD
MQQNRDSVEPYTIYKGSKYVFDILWDAVDDTGHSVPEGEYTIHATIESPDYDTPGQLLLLDCAVSECTHLITVE